MILKQFYILLNIYNKPPLITIIHFQNTQAFFFEYAFHSFIVFPEQYPKNFSGILCWIKRGYNCVLILLDVQNLLQQSKRIQMNLLMKQAFSFAKVGVIGLGNMGLPMAANLAANGHQVFGYDLDSSRASLAAQKKVTFKSQIKDVARQADIFVTMVPNSQHSIQVCESDGGLFKNAKKNSLIIDSSTISPVVASQLNKKAKDFGITYVDAPVSGGVGGATAGTLTFMVGAESEDVFNQCKPYLEGMGKKFFNCGRAGNGQVIKLCNNMSLAVQMIGICQSLAMAEKLGMDPAEASKILSVSTARCHSVDTYNPVPGHLPNAPSSRNYDNGFGSSLMLKDAKLAIEAAKGCGINAELGIHSVDIYEKVVEKGFGKKDFSIVYELLRKNQL